MEHSKLIRVDIDNVYCWVDLDSDPVSVYSAKMKELLPWININDGRHYLKLRFNGESKTVSLKRIVGIAEKTRQNQILENKNQENKIEKDEDDDE